MATIPLTFNTGSITQANAVKYVAKGAGYQPTIPNPNPANLDKTIPNPVSAVEFVKQTMAIQLKSWYKNGRIAEAQEADTTEATVKAESDSMAVT